MDVCFFISEVFIKRLTIIIGVGVGEGVILVLDQFFVIFVLRVQVSSESHAHGLNPKLIGNERDVVGGVH